MPEIAATAVIHPNVRLGDDVSVGPWAVVGAPPEGTEPGELETIVGSGSVIRSHSIVYAGSRFGPRFQTGHQSVLGPGLEVGDGCSVGTGTVLAGFAKLYDGARIHSLCYVGPFASIHVKAWVGPYGILRSDVDDVTVVASGAILALRVHVSAGIRIGERALVGTRCLIHTDVPPYRLVVGNPARAVRSIDQVVSPIAEIGRPYQADPPELQQQVLARHARRDGCRIDEEDWRLALWKRLQNHFVPLASPGIFNGAAAFCQARLQNTTLESRGLQ